MALGVPAKIRENAASADLIAMSAASYVENGRYFKAQMRRIS